MNGPLEAKKIGLPSALEMKSTFRQESQAQAKESSMSINPERLYARWGNPNSHELGKELSLGFQMSFGLCFSSGMAAISTTLLALLKEGDTLWHAGQIYGGTSEMMAYLKSVIKVNLKVFYSYDELREALEDLDSSQAQDKPKAIYFETLTNPLLEFYDPKTLSRLCQKHKIISIVDTTFAPYPLISYEGCDVVLNSLTKSINGHSDALGGYVGTDDQEIFNHVWMLQKVLGSHLSAHEAWMISRGLRTLEIRLEKQSQTADQVAKYLNEHPLVEKVFYPGVSKQSQEANLDQMKRGFGGVLSFLTHKDIKNPFHVIDSLKVFEHAVSLGSVEALACHPWSTTHGGVEEKLKLKLGILPNLIRLSVGLESAEDLIFDLNQSLQSATKATSS